MQASARLMRPSSASSCASSRASCATAFNLLALLIMAAVDVGRHGLAAHHAIDVGALEPKHALHAHQRSNRVELRAQLLEQLALTLAADEDDVEPDLLAGAGTYEGDLRARILLNIFNGFREKLVGEGDVLLVDVTHLGQVGDVGNALGGASCDH